MVTASWKALTIQTGVAGATVSSCAMIGRATLTIAPSRTAIAVAMPSVASASRRCGFSRPSWTAWAGGDAAGGCEAASFNMQARGSRIRRREILSFRPAFDERHRFLNRRRHGEQRLPKPDSTVFTHLRSPRGSLPQLAGEGGVRASKDARLSTGYGAGWGVARCIDARRLARTLPRTCGPSALLSTPHPSPSATPSPLRGEGGARRPPARSPSAPHRRNRRRRKSLKISRAALCPGAPVTPPPGWVDAPHI